MKLLAGELPALAGTRTEARDLALGYFAQHQLEQLHAGANRRSRSLQAPGRRCERGAPRGEQELRDFLAGFGFRGDRVFEPVAPFSGGEKARLVLALRQPIAGPTCCCSMSRPIISISKCARPSPWRLQDYEGAVVLVSHDRHLLRTVADEFFWCTPAVSQPFDGDLEDYARWLAEHAPDSTPAVSNAMAPPPLAAPAGVAKSSARVASGRPSANGSAGARKDRKRAEAQRRAMLGPLRARVAQYEQRIEALGDEAAKIERELLQATAANDAGRITLLSKERARVASSIAAAESGWMLASEELERSGGN